MILIFPGNSMAMYENTTGRTPVGAGHARYTAVTDAGFPVLYDDIMHGTEPLTYPAARTGICIHADGKAPLSHVAANLKGVNQGPKPLPPRK